MNGRSSMRVCLASFVGLAAVTAASGTSWAQSTTGDAWDDDAEQEYDGPSVYSAPYDPTFALDGTYDTTNYADDWFYDGYVFDENAIYRPYSYDYDWDADTFDWETTGSSDTGPGERGRQMSQRMKRSREVSGKILATKRVDLPAGDSQNLVAMIATDRGDARLIIDFGPLDRLSRSERQSLQRGAQITSEGAVKVVGGENVLMARRVRADDRDFWIDRPAQYRPRRR